MEYIINSSHIIKIDYDQANLNVTVYFNGGSVYNYYPFYENQVKYFLESDSKGKWWNKNIKKNRSIRYKKIR